MQTDKTKQFEYNLNVLKRRDAAIVEILDMSGHVVLYQFNEETQAWDRKNVEGGLFVVARSSEPKHMFVVMNRLSNDIVVEGLSADFQMELTEQFLLYRNEKQEINGIWFYAAHERASIAELLQHLIATAASDTPTAGVDAAIADSPSEATPSQQATGEQGGSVPDASTSVVANGSSAHAPADDTTANNVAEFFSMAQNHMPPSAEGSPSLVPSDAATACNVAEFFSMAQQLPPSVVPPMPTGATNAAAAHATVAAGTTADISVTEPVATAVPTHGSATGHPVPPQATAPDSRAAAADEPPATAAGTSASATEATASPPANFADAVSTPAAGVARADIAALKLQLRQQLISLVNDDAFMTVLATEYLQQKGEAPAAPVVDGALLTLLQQQRLH